MEPSDGKTCAESYAAFERHYLDVPSLYLKPLPRVKQSRVTSGRAQHP